MLCVCEVGMRQTQQQINKAKLDIRLVNVLVAPNMNVLRETARHHLQFGYKLIYAIRPISLLWMILTDRCLNAPEVVPIRRDTHDVRVSINAPRTVSVNIPLQKLPKLFTPYLNRDQKALSSRLTIKFRVGRFGIS